MPSNILAQVLIVGSGPAGLALALALLRSGVSVRIVEKNAEHHNSERGAGVAPRTLEIEHFLGVGEEVRCAGMGSPIMMIFDPKDPFRVAKSFEMVERIAPTPAFPITEAVMVGQWLHQQILRKHLETFGCYVELNCALTSLEQQEDGVTAQLLHMRDGKQSEETAKFAYVVGADGARSTVRKSLGVNFVGESRDMRVYLVDARIEGLPESGRAFLRWGDGGANIVSLRYTVHPGVFQMLLAGEHIDFDALKTGTVEAIQSAFHMLSGRADLKVKEILSHGEWRPNMRIAEHFRVGRVFIVGDAAHVHPPSGGQGLNTSIQDSFNLAWKLALSLKSHASPSLLDSYESERLPVIAEMLHITTGLFNKLIARAETQLALRAAAQSQSQSQSQSHSRSQSREVPSEGTIDKDKEIFSRGRRLLQLDLNYRWSEIVFDERFTRDGDEKGNAYGVEGHDVRAGDRAPDAPGLACLDDAEQGEKKTTRLFELFSAAAHAVLVFGSDYSSPGARALVEPLRDLPKGLVRTMLVVPATASGINRGDKSPATFDDVFRDTEGHAYTGYGLGLNDLPIVVVVRPDGVIGAFARSAAGVEKYLTLVFA